MFLPHCGHGSDCCHVDDGLHLPCDCCDELVDDLVVEEVELGSRDLVVELALDIVVEELALALGIVVQDVGALGLHEGVEDVEPHDVVDGEEEARSSVGDDN